MGRQFPCRLPSARPGGARGGDGAARQPHCIGPSTFVVLFGTPQECPDGAGKAQAGGQPPPLQKGQKKNPQKKTNGSADVQMLAVVSSGQPRSARKHPPHLSIRGASVTAWESRCARFMLVCDRNGDYVDTAKAPSTRTREGRLQPWTRVDLNIVEMLQCWEQIQKTTKKHIL